MQRVHKYIDEHIDADLHVEILSGVAAFSKYHFHRQFTESFGIGVHRYVQLVRLKRASYRLAFRADARAVSIINRWRGRAHPLCRDGGRQPP